MKIPQIRHRAIIALACGRPALLLSPVRCLVQHPWLTAMMPACSGERRSAEVPESVAVREQDDTERIVLDDGSTPCSVDQPVERQTPVAEAVVQPQEE